MRPTRPQQWTSSWEAGTSSLRVMSRLYACDRRMCRLRYVKLNMVEPNASVALADCGAGNRVLQVHKCCLGLCSGSRSDRLLTVHHADKGSAAGRPTCCQCNLINCLQELGTRQRRCGRDFSERARGVPVADSLHTTRSLTSPRATAASSDHSR